MVLVVTMQAVAKKRIKSTRDDGVSAGWLSDTIGIGKANAGALSAPPVDTIQVSSSVITCLPSCEIYPTSRPPTQQHHRICPFRAFDLMIVNIAAYHQRLTPAPGRPS
jgi:hypothetical protein